MRKLVLLLVVGAVGCGGDITAPPPGDSGIDSDLLVAAGDPGNDANSVMLSVSGAGKITGPPGQDQFNFNARMRSDGTVSGHVEFVSVFFGQTLRGNVVCMAWKQTTQNPFGPPITPRTFLAIGTDMASPDPNNTGPYFLLSLIDGGEGANAAPDKLLPDFIPPFAYPGGPPATASESCGSFGLPDFLLDIAQIDNGNINVNLH
jgi:hypothetical protein